MLDIVGINGNTVYYTDFLHTKNVTCKTYPMNVMGANEYDLIILQDESVYYALDKQNFTARYIISSSGHEFYIDNENNAYEKPNYGRGDAKLIQTNVNKIISFWMQTLIHTDNQTYILLLDGSLWVDNEKVQDIPFIIDMDYDLDYMLLLDIDGYVWKRIEKLKFERIKNVENIISISCGDYGRCGLLLDKYHKVWVRENDEYVCHKQLPPIVSICCNHLFLLCLDVNGAIWIINRHVGNDRKFSKWNDLQFTSLPRFAKVYPIRSTKSARK